MPTKGTKTGDFFYYYSRRFFDRSQWTSFFSLLILNSQTKSQGWNVVSYRAKDCGKRGNCNKQTKKRHLRIKIRKDACCYLVHEPSIHTASFLVKGVKTGFDTIFSDHMCQKVRGVLSFFFLIHGFIYKARYIFS